MMSVPDYIKENVRAVLLSKTDGSGILVSQFLKDYKSFVQEPLILKKHGYDGLEKFLKDIPDVCRLEYSEKHMAYKLFGITKPNTFVSSFVKKAEGSSPSSRDSENSDRKRMNDNEDKRERFLPTMDLNEKWEPNDRGLYSLCFPCRKSSQLKTKEDVAVTFTQFGEVVDINMISGLTFVRYRDERAAKKALERFGGELGLKRAEERSSSSKKSSGKKRSSGLNVNNSNQANKGNRQTMNETKKTCNVGNHGDSDWDDGYTSNAGKETAPGGYPYMKPEVKNAGTVPASGCHSSSSSNSSRSSKIQEPRDGNSKRGYLLPTPSIPCTEPIDVYVGNWPADAGEKELKQLLKPFRYISHRFYSPKGPNMKKIVFVECETLEDAQRIINSLDKTLFLQRKLQVRLGKKGNTGNEHPDTITQDKSNSTGLEQEFANITVKKDVKSRQDRMNDRMPDLESIHKDEDMPPLESIQPPTLSPSMPRLENSHRSLGGMPTLENISPTPQSRNTTTSEVTSAQLNVGNFPYGTTERELMNLMYPFGARSVQIMNSDVTSRSTYAFVDFENTQLAIDAMMNLDQSLFKSRKLVVTLSNTQGVAQPKQEQRAEKMRTITEPDMSLSQISPISSIDSALERSVRPNREHFNFQRLTDTLHDYVKISTRLRADKHPQLIEGMSLKVMITHTENQRFFWGQILEDSENGMNTDLQNLVSLTEELQVEPKHTTMDGLGRCMAKYENDWFRAWNTFETKKNGQIYGDLMFIDYGNRLLVPKDEIFKTKQYAWVLPPMAKPFKLVDAKYDLEKFVNNLVVLEIVEPGTQRNNLVSTVNALHWSS